MRELQCRICGGVVRDASLATVKPVERTVGAPMPHGGTCHCRAPVVDGAVGERPQGDANPGRRAHR